MSGRIQESIDTPHLRRRSSGVPEPCCVLNDRSPCLKNTSKVLESFACSKQMPAGSPLGCLTSHYSVLPRLKRMVKQVVWRSDTRFFFSDFDVCWKLLEMLKMSSKARHAHSLLPAICQKRPGRQQ